MNLFEQQAKAEQGLRLVPVPLPVFESPMLQVMRFIDSADIEQCGKVAIQLAARLFTLEKQHDGMKASNLNEAAHFIADSALDIDAALRMDDAKPCSCGKCDSCVAARSDEHHDRHHDGLAA